MEVTSQLRLREYFELSVSNSEVKDSPENKILINLHAQLLLLGSSNDLRDFSQLNDFNNKLEFQSNLNFIDVVKHQR